MRASTQTRRAEDRAPGATSPFPWGRALLYALLALFALFYLLPVFIVINTSLKTFQEVSTTSIWTLPARPSLAAYADAFDQLRGGLINSALVAAPAVLLSALLGSLNGYVLSKWRFRNADLAFTLMLFGMFIPYQSVLIPLVQFLRGIGLYGTLPGLILVHVVYGLPIVTLIFRNYYATVPHALLEAAKIDGAGFFGIYRWVVLPVSVPGFVVVMIWQFTAVWNEFLFAVTVTSDPARQPVTVALQGLAGSFLSQWHVQMAGALLTALPTLAVYLLLGRYFVSGLLAGSVKG